MKSFSFVAGALAMIAAGSFLPAPAAAAGCLKGAVVGAVAGHYAGNHGVLGAGAGCVIGRHEANKDAKMRDQQNDHRYGNAGSLDDTRRAP